MRYSNEVKSQVSEYAKYLHKIRKVPMNEAYKISWNVAKALLKNKRR